MMFCPKCSSLLKTKQVKAKNVHFCSCGYTSDIKQDTTFKEKVDKSKDEIQVVEERDDIHPIVEQHCDKCNHDKAYFWLTQTRAGDEPETKFFKCEKCKHTWRDYS